MFLSQRAELAMTMKNMLCVSLCMALGACDSAQDKPAGATITVVKAGASAPASASAVVMTPPVASAAVAVSVAASAIPDPAPMVRGLDVGKTYTQATKTAGTGKSMSAAVNDAIRNAILQANGTTVDLTSQQFKFALDVATDVADVGIRAAGFASMVEQRSRGAITGFKLDSAEGPDASGNYKVWIEAAVAKYSPPEADSKKIKLVIAPIRFDAKSFTVGGRSIPATQVAQDIRNKIQESLNQSGRFAILDRQFNAEIEQELDMVESGATPNSQFGKLSQAFSADLIWIGRIHALGYVRHTQQLRMSDRSLVSYSGGWAFSQKLVNVATRQVMAANSMHDKMPGTAPTTLGVSVDSGKNLSAMSNGIAQQVVNSIMASSFPVSVVSREGNAVILSQGANALKVGVRYQMIALGAELKDPQTGLSLGRTESNCCEVVIDRVTPTLSYGHLESVNIALDTVPTGGLLVREPIRGGNAAAAQNAKASGAAAPRARRSSGGGMSEPAPLQKPKRNESDW
jgi:curli biogenesis system outer membrane secretion channel CsgG